MSIFSVSALPYTITPFAGGPSTSDEKYHIGISCYVTCLATLLRCSKNDTLFFIPESDRGGVDDTIPVMAAEACHLGFSQESLNFLVCEMR
jgi:hypothetical protein